METDIIKKMLITVVAVVAIIGVSYLIGRRDGQNISVRGESVKVDTLFIFDTITQYEPILEERVVLEKVPYPVTDTMWKHDTMYVILEREQVVWQDSLSRVYASGILPQIDSVQHFIQERIVTMELTKVVKKPCRWGIGVHAGYGIQLGESVRMSPYVGVGLTYNIVSW